MPSSPAYTKFVVRVLHISRVSAVRWPVLMLPDGSTSTVVVATSACNLFWRWSLRWLLEAGIFLGPTTRDRLISALATLRQLSIGTDTIIASVIAAATDAVKAAIAVLDQVPWRT